MEHKITFEEAKNLIVRGKNIDIDQIKFDLNTLDIEIKYEDDITYITKKTLLHMAIESQNVAALQTLIKNGASLDLMLNKEEHRKNTDEAMREALFPEWQKPILTNIVGYPVMRLANDTHNPNIITIISEAQKAAEISNVSTSYLPLFSDTQAKKKEESDGEPPKKKTKFEVNKEECSYQPQI